MCSYAEVYTYEKEIYMLLKSSHFRETPDSEYATGFSIFGPLLGAFLSLGQWVKRYIT